MAVNDTQCILNELSINIVYGFYSHFILVFIIFMYILSCLFILSVPAVCVCSQVSDECPEWLKTFRRVSDWH